MADEPQDQTAPDPQDQTAPPTQATAEQHLAKLDEIIAAAIEISAGRPGAEPQEATRVKALSVAEQALSQKAAILGLYRHG